MKNVIRKAAFSLLPAVFLFTAVQAANFNELNKVGVVNNNLDAPQQMVIYNSDETKCLSTYGHNRKGTNVLTYETCRIDSYDTWTITSSGKIKNQRSGKCLTSPQGRSTLTLARCNRSIKRGYTAYDFVILNHLDVPTNNGIEVAQLD
ncbi:ricin-type beta-trefoil lectin domain protein [Alteromonas stellipolaris]|uniref:ricin-type beta-trefoil lectin domain protein n=1 Tax=Alteromonas stellipolaris TaxID=233316 RepID=UPI0026E242F7|nr:ricin-type beta-trefoil lectin domain protein [Alteromonas stellipolaris]MDO6537461.1 ricin-type beta-trefoil lectin domain protein [Alteromonas stellipolaris]